MFSAAFETALRATGLPTAHYGWDKTMLPSGDYIVFAEDGANDFMADELHGERATEGTVDLFTRNYARDAAGPVEQALEALPALAWSLNSIQFEEDTRYVHYEWVVQELGKV